MWLFFATQYNSSLSSFVLNFRILTQVVAEECLTEKNYRQTNQETHKHNYRKGKNSIPPIYFVPGGMNNLLYSDRHFNDLEFEIFKECKANGHDSCLVYISK